MKKIITVFISLFLIAVMLTVNTFALTPTYTVSEPYRNSIYYKLLCDVKLTGDYAKDLLAVAKSQLGYHEGAFSGDTSGYSTGSKNYTEYCDWYGKTVAWCALFISWCARQARIPESVINTNINARGTACLYGETKYDFGKYDPLPGDIIYVDNDADGSSDHVGLVTGLDNNYIYTIEGNLSAKVHEMRYYRYTGKQVYSGTQIIFFGVPEYNLNKVTTPEYEPGDVDADGKVNSSDALFVLNYSVGLWTMTAEQKKRADMDSDGKYDSYDALLILKMSVE